MNEATRIKSTVTAGIKLVQLGFSESFIQNDFVDNALSKSKEASRTKAFSDIYSSDQAVQKEFTQMELAKAVIVVGKLVKALGFTDSYIKDSIVQTSLRGENKDFRKVTYQQIMRG